MDRFYNSLVSRNSGYVNSHLQEKISKSRVLIAGCGIGSQVAEAAARMGFQNFILVDADVIDVHNLNRQSFFSDQVGRLKVDALKENILRINPQANVRAVPELIGASNAKELVKASDIILDTIDFLDLPGIVALHDEVHLQKKILVSSFSVGFGAAIISFAPNARGHSWIRDIFSLPSVGPVDSISYVERYQKLFANIAPGLDPVVLQVMTKVFQDLADGKTCPAPQVAPGANAVAAVCVTSVVRLMSGESVSLGPRMLVLNLNECLSGAGFDLVLSPTGVRAA